MSIIWPGLDLIIKSDVSRRTRGGIRYAYPFQLYPPVSGFDRGKLDQSFMDEISALWKRLHSKSKSGGRVEMDTIELRTLIFTIRAYIDFVRYGRHSGRPYSQKAKTLLRIDNESLERLKISSKRVILTLERHLKRANRALQRSIPQSAFVALTRAWRAHLLWMRLNIAYFRTSPPVVVGRKTHFDELMKMAERAIRHEGYQPPDAKELRRMMRLFASSAWRGREALTCPVFLSQL